MVLVYILISYNYSLQLVNYFLTINFDYKKQEAFIKTTLIANNNPLDINPYNLESMMESGVIAIG